jgi:hypothetical protein
MNNMQGIKHSTRWHLFVLLLSAILLNSCAITPTEKPEAKPTAAAHATYPTDLHGAQLYRVEAQDSSVHILVYRGGAMAKMGHNHVISAANLGGYIWRKGALDGSGFDLVVPVNELIVDDNAARAAEGAEFPLNVDDSAKQGTKTNMLSETVLDGAHFPAITIKSITMSGALDAPQVTAELRIKNQMHQVMVPVTIKAQGDRLEVRGEFKMLQSDFGITPFTVALGALSVVDSVTIKFALVAKRVES